MLRRKRIPPLQLPAWCMLVCGLSASLILFFWAYGHEQRSEHVIFERNAQFRAESVQQGLDNAISALWDINQLFAINDHVSREQFQSLAQSQRSRYPYINAFMFSRLVSREERPAFEDRMRTRYPGFSIADMIHGKRAVAAMKESYRVIDYLEPWAGNEALFGLDASSRSLADGAIARATDTGLPSATGLSNSRGLVPETGAQRSLRILMAVYRGGAAPDSVAARQRAVIGYTVAVLRTGELFDKLLSEPDRRVNAGLDIRVYAAASADESKLAYGSPGAADAEGEGWPPSWLFGGRKKSFSHDFDLAGTPWHVLISARPTAFVASHFSALLALLMGVFVTVAASAYLQSWALRTRRVEQLVAQRTGELKQVNDLLIEREQHARELADLSSDWSWTMDEHLCFASMASSGDNQGRPLPRPVLGKPPWEMPVDLGASDWTAHRALLQAHQPIKDFEFKTLLDGIPPQWISSSGKPQFDAQGRFKGYRGTSRNISDRKQAEEALQHSRSQLRKLAHHQESVKEDERKRIARDIHDDLGQNLLALRLDVSRMVECHVSCPSMMITDRWCKQALDQIDVTIKSVRSIIIDLRPGVLDLGLHAAVEWLAKEFEVRSGIACDLLIDHEEFALDDERATALFRIVQESLTNIIRHAQAGMVKIELRRSDDRLFMKIADDGIGLAPDCTRKETSFGLIGMQERIHALGGEFSTESSPGQGLAIIFSIPLQA